MVGGTLCKGRQQMSYSSISKNPLVLWWSNSYTAHLPITFRHRWAHWLEQPSLITVSIVCRPRKNKGPYPVSVCSKQTEVCRLCFYVWRKQMEIAVFFLVPFFRLWNSANVESWTWRHGDMDMERSHGKPKPRQFSLIYILFAHHANGILLFVRLLRKNNGSYPFANRLNGLNRLAHLLI